MSYRTDKLVIDGHTDTHTHTHAGNDNTRRPKLASGIKWIWMVQLIVSFIISQNSLNYCCPENHFQVNSLASTRCGCNLKLVIFKLASRIDIISISCEIAPKVNDTRPHWWFGNTALGNVLVPWGNKPLSESMVTNINVVTMPQRFNVCDLNHDNYTFPGTYRWPSMLGLGTGTLFHLSFWIKIFSFTNHNTIHFSDFLQDMGPFNITKDVFS